MDPLLFQEACRWALSGEAREGGIGTLGEKTLHSAVKYYVQPDPSRREVRLGPYVADALTEDGVSEIQTRSLYRLGPKLRWFLEQGPVTVVYPVPAKKTVAWIDGAGEITPARKSPLKPTAGCVLGELYPLRELLSHPRLRLRVLLLEVAEYRLLNGWSRDKKRGSTRFDRVPLSLLGEVWVRSPGEYGKLLPEGLPETFTSRELGRAVGLSPKRATLAANVLRGLGAIAPVGKRGPAYLYARAEASRRPCPILEKG